MDLNELRNQIDRIDSELVTLFVQRMHICAEVAAYKSENGLPVHIPQRELAVLEKVAASAGPEMAEYAKDLYNKIFHLSRNYQETKIH